MWEELFLFYFSFFFGYKKKTEITSPATQSSPMLDMLHLFKSHLIATDGPLAGLEQHFRSN